MSSVPTCLDMFCGAGGLSLGLSQAGFNLIAAFDNDASAVDTYNANIPGSHGVRELIEEVAGRRLRKLVPDAPDWIVGGPPCQGFSTVGRRDRSDPRNRLFEHFSRVVRTLQPRGFLLENVLGLRDMRFVSEVKHHFARSGYAVTSFVLRASDFGVPQLRRRVFFVGSRDGRFFAPPVPLLRAQEYVTVWDAIGDLPPLKPGEIRHSYDAPPFTAYQRSMREGAVRLQGHEASKHPPRLVEAISHIPDGGNRRSIPDHLQPASGFHNSYSRLYSKAPAVAVTQNMGKPSGTRCIHPFQHRGLTAREGARLQSFPDVFEFRGAMMSQRLQVANAVPPLLAEAVGRALLATGNWHDSEADMVRAASTADGNYEVELLGMAEMALAG